MVSSALALSFTATYVVAADAFSPSDVKAIIGLGAGLNAAPLLALLICLRPGWLLNALLAVLTVVGIATTHAIHAELARTNALLAWLLLGAAGFASFVAFDAVDRSRWFGPAAASLTLLAAVACIAFFWHRGNIVTTGDTSNIRNIEFQRQPNLYFISFDSIQPRALLRKYMNVETTPFHSLFDAHFRRFENLFANAFSSRESLGVLLALDERIYHSIVRPRAQTLRPRYPSMFAGASPSPLFDILKKNGYETNTFYSNTFFGPEKGPFVDRYFTTAERSVCALLDPAIHDVSFWGYCNWAKATTSSASTADRLIEISRHDGPQFLMAHIQEPGHTALSFRYDDKAQVDEFRQRYLAGASSAAGHLTRLLAHLQENDPDAILLVYGDHGPFLSRGVTFEDAPAFVVQDHFGILGGIYPRHACAQWFDEPRERQGYLTLLDAVHGVLRCLSGDERTLHHAPAFYPVGNWHGRTPGGESMSYERFAYE